MGVLEGGAGSVSFLEAESVELGASPLLGSFVAKGLRG